MTLIAVITGAASGLGRLAAQRLVVEGWTVAAIDLPGEALETMAESVGAYAFGCDVGDPEQVRRVRDEVLSRLGGIDRLVNAAGIARPGTVTDVPEDEFARSIRVNYLGTVHWVKAVLPTMRARGSGEMVLFASFAGFFPTPGMGAYVATKFAVVGFYETLAMELHGSGIKIRCVCPAAVDTPMLDGIFAAGLPDRMRALSRTTSPEAVIGAIDASLRVRREAAFVFPDVMTRVLWRLRRASPGLLSLLVRKVSAGAARGT